ncbi:MAG: hypothetical protein ACLPKB_32405 [Xanthobacteraceae bacterium]
MGDNLDDMAVIELPESPKLSDVSLPDVTQLMLAEIGPSLPDRQCASTIVRSIVSLFRPVH